MDRYHRHIVMDEVGVEGQKKISSSRVLVVGAGGLGCPVMQYLTAAGVATLGILDHDHIELSNLQRQVLYGHSDVGKLKVEVAQARLSAMNPDVQIKAYPFKLDIHNAIQLFENYDIIVDGTDNISTRYLINDYTLITGKPMVYGSVHQFEGQVSVFNYNGGPSYRCLFPIPPGEDEVPNCAELGVLGVLPGIVGSIQANEVLKIILEMEGVMTGKIWYFNAKSNSSETFEFSRNQMEINKVLTHQTRDQLASLQDCALDLFGIDLSELPELEQLLFVDVREPHEIPRIDHPSILRLPWSRFKEGMAGISTGKIPVFFCQSGNRSAKAAGLYAHEVNARCYSLNQSAKALEQHLMQEQYEA